MRHGKLSALARAAGLCLLGLALGAGVSTGTTLTGMAVSSEGDVTRIHVMLDQPVEWSHFALSDPARLFVDCRGVDTVLPKTLPKSEGRAGKIEASVWKGEGYHALTRITIDLTQASQTDVKSVEDGLLITLGPVGVQEWTAGEATSAPASTESTTTAEVLTPAETMTPTDSTTPAAETPAPAAAETPAPTAAETPAQTPTAGDGETTDQTSVPAGGVTSAEPTSTADPGTSSETPASESIPAAQTAPPSMETPETVTPGTSGAVDATAAGAPGVAAEPPAETPAPAGRPISAPDFESELTPAETMAEGAGVESAPATPAEPAPDYSLPPSYADASKRKAVAVKTIPLSDEAGLAARGGARVSLDIQGADIYTVLRSISEYSGVNIVMGYDVNKAVKDPVSFHLESVPWGEALEMVLRSAHLWYREEGNVIRVDTEENLRNEDLARSNAARALEEVMPLTTRIVEVIYANARELKGTVEKSLSRRGVVEVDERSNSLVITDIRSRVEGAVEMVQHLDSQTPQVEIVAKLVDVDAQESRELGVLWSGNNSGSNGDVTINGPDPNLIPDNALLGFNKVTDPALGVRFGLVKSWGEVNATISALEKENKANIISNPRITTVNNREARILVGQKIPLIVLDEAGNPVTELTTIGITLRVVPHINDQKRITLDLHPEVSDLSSQATVQGGVIINTSEADTRVMVGNGETAVIGGLIRSNDVRTQTGVPILMDIPIIGSLFSQTGTSQAKRELLIFVTPRIIDSFSAESDED